MGYHNKAFVKEFSRKRKEKPIMAVLAAMALKLLFVDKICS